MTFQQYKTPFRSPSKNRPQCRIHIWMNLEQVLRQKINGCIFGQRKGCPCAGGVRHRRARIRERISVEANQCLAALFRSHRSNLRAQRRCRTKIIHIRDTCRNRMSPSDGLHRPQASESEKIGNRIHEDFWKEGDIRLELGNARPRGIQLTRQHDPSGNSRIGLLANCVIRCSSGFENRYFAIRAGGKPPQQPMQQSANRMIEKKRHNNAIRREPEAARLLHNAAKSRQAKGKA